MSIRRRIHLTGSFAVVMLVLTGCAGEGLLGAPQTAAPSPPSSSASPRPPAPTGDASPPPAPAAPGITILNPSENATVTAPLIMDGRSSAFEAQLVVDARNEAGEFFCIRHVSATSGSGVEGSWSAVLGFAPERESDAPITLRAYELSAEDGSMVNLVERRVTLSAARPPIFLTSPACADVYSAGGAMAIQGRATVFEAALTVELRNAAGEVLFSRSLMTEEGGVESNFGEYVTLPSGIPPGLYDVVAFSISAEDGSMQDQFPIQIRIR